MTKPLSNLASKGPGAGTYEARNRAQTGPKHRLGEMSTGSLDFSDPSNLPLIAGILKGSLTILCL